MAFRKTFCYRSDRSSIVSHDIVMRSPWGQIMRMNVRRNFKFKIPAEIYRLASVAIVAGLLMIAVIYSHGANVAAEANSRDSKVAFQQPKDRQQADERSIPTPKIAEISEDKGVEIANALPLPRRRPATPGFYYELVRAQGDGGEGEYVLTPKQCIPNVDMPEPCYQPERGRQNFPIRRE
jgi:hypothetical protein